MLSSSWPLHPRAPCESRYALQAQSWYTDGCCQGGLLMSWLNCTSCTLAPGPQVPMPHLARSNAGKGETYIDKKTWHVITPALHLRQWEMLFACVGATS